LKRGEVYWIAFDPSVGGEIQKTRPAVIVSNDAANTALNRVIVVPISSKTDRVYPGEALIELNGEARKAMADQLTTASKLLLKSRLGNISTEDMGRIERAILLQLGIKT
jgi:mRNA interferase MazF